MADLKGYITTAGQNFEALAKQLNYPVKIGFIEIGDGTLPDGSDPRAQTALVNKIKQFPATIERDPQNTGVWIATCTIPADDAIGGQGYMIREMGCKLVDQGAGILYAYRRVSNDFKPVITSGEAKSFIYRLRFIPTNGELLTPTIDPTMVLVARDELDRVINAHKESRDHPDASEAAKGFMRFATAAEAVPATEAAASDALAASIARVFTVLRSAVANASETLRGTLRIATQAEMDAASLNNVAVPPAKLANHYKRSNIVGAVSQSAGTPAGAIIERGDNANGKYTRFADGTLIQWLPAFNYTGSISAGAVGNFGAKPLPSSFVDTSYIALGSTSGMASYATSAVKVSLEQRAQAQIGNVVIGNASNANVDLSTFEIHVVIIGRWY